MSGKVNSRHARQDHRRDARQMRQTRLRDIRQADKTPRSRKLGELVGDITVDIDVRDTVPMHVYTHMLHHVAMTETVEPPPVKLAGVVLATVASALATGLPQPALAEAGGRGPVALGAQPQALETVLSAPPPVPAQLLRPGSAENLAEGSPLLGHSRHLLDLSSDIAALSAVGDSPFQLNDYGSVLSTNKQSLIAGVAAAGGSVYVQTLAVAVGMLETNHMSPSERDSSKDGYTDGSKNCSPLNICAALWNAMGVTDTDWMNQATVDMNRLGQVFATGVNTVGLAEFMGFTRVGSDWSHPTSDEQVWIQQYQHGLGTVVKQIQADPTLLSDTRRVEVSIPHIG